MSLTAQKNILQGTVYEYNEKGKNKTLSDVVITAPLSQNCKSGSGGNYSLVFDNETHIAIITVFKPGYELINSDKDAYNQATIDLSLVKQFHIYLDKEGNTEKRKKDLEAAYDFNAKRKRDAYYARIYKSDIEADKVKRELEKQSGRFFHDIDDVKSYIAERYGANKKIINDLIPAILRQNLDHSTEEVGKYKRLILEGKDDAILKIIAALDLKKDSINAVEQNRTIANMLEISKNKKEKFRILIPNMLSDGQYEKVASSYRLIILLDTTDLDSYIMYAAFLQHQNRLAESKKVYEILLPKVEKTKNKYFKATVLNNIGVLLMDVQEYDQAQRILQEGRGIFGTLTLDNPDVYVPAIAVFNNLGILFKKTQHDSLALKYFYEVLDARRKLAIKNPDVYHPDVAEALNNIAILLSDNQQNDLARKSYEEALDIYRKLVIKSPDLYLPYLATIVNNLGILFADIKQTEKAGKCLEEALDIRRTLARKNPEIYRAEVATSLSNLGSLLFQKKQYSAAQASFEEALEIYNNLARENPDVYLPNKAVILNNFGALLREATQLNLAKKYLEEGLDIRRKLEIKNSAVYLPDVAASLNNLGLTLTDLKQHNLALYDYQEAVKILRGLTLKNPDVYLPKLATLLTNLGILFKEITQYKKSEENLEESLNIYSNLALKNPGIYQHSKYNTLVLLCSVFAVQKKYKEAASGYETLSDYLSSQNVYYSEDSLLAEIKINYGLGSLYEIMSDSNGKSIIYYTRAKTKKDRLYKNGTIIYNNAILKKIDSALSSAYGNFSWYQLFQKKYDSSEINARRGLNIDSTQSWIKVNLAHALLLQGKYGEAVVMYQKLRKDIYPPDNSKTFGEIFLDDLTELENRSAIPTIRKEEISRIKAMLKNE